MMHAEIVIGVIVRKINVNGTNEKRELASHSENQGPNKFNSFEVQCQLNKTTGKII